MVTFTHYPFVIISLLQKEEEEETSGYNRLMKETVSDTVKNPHIFKKKICFYIILYEENKSLPLTFTKTHCCTYARLKLQDQQLLN